MTRTELNNLIAALIKLRNEATDETALESVAAYPSWKPNIDYALDTRVRHNDVLYRCAQAHTSQENWTPDATPALWVRVSLEEFPEWVQPLGAQDAYNTGDKVLYNDKHWVSSVDSNIWAPGVYGWEEIIN